MNSPETLQREDIVGKIVSGIFQTDWKIDDDGFGACAPYVELQDGTVFELQSDDFEVIPPVAKVELKELAVSPNREPYIIQCIGQSVLEVLVSSYWPCLGLLLSNYYFLYMRDFPNPSRSGALLIGPYADLIGETYNLDDVLPYWGEERP